MAFIRQNRSSLGWYVLRATSQADGSACYWHCSSRFGALRKGKRSRQPGQQRHRGGGYVAGLGRQQRVERPERQASPLVRGTAACPAGAAGEGLWRSGADGEQGPAGLEAHRLPAAAGGELRQVIPPRGGILPCGATALTTAQIGPERLSALEFSA